MKGPGMRLDLDVRRLWRCPACSTQRQTPGRVTFVRCHFCKDHPAMVLIERPRPSRPPRPPLDLIIDLHPDDVNAPAFVPAHLREPEPPESVETQPAEAPPEFTPSPPPDAAASAAAPEAVTEQRSDQPVAAEGAQEPAADEASPPPRNRKKRRSRRQRRRNRSAGSGETAGSGPADAPAARPPDDSFGAGLVK